jgi:hypothetical protein
MEITEDRLTEACKTCQFSVVLLLKGPRGAKTRKEQLLCFLCALCDFAPLRETLFADVSQGSSISADKNK